MDKSQIKSAFPVSADQMCLSQFLIIYKTAVIFMLCKYWDVYCFALRLCYDNLGLLLSYYLFVCRNKRHLIHGHWGSALQRDFGNILWIERLLVCFEVNYHMLMLQHNINCTCHSLLLICRVWLEMHCGPPYQTIPLFLLLIF